MDVLHFPISFPEMLFLLFLPFCRKHFHFASLARNQTMVLFLGWVMMIALALLVGKYPLYAILSTARSYLYLLLFYLLFCKENNVTISHAYYVSAGAFVGWIVDAAHSFNTTTLLVSDEVAVSYGPMLCIPILIGTQTLKGKCKMLVFTLFLSVVLMVLSGMRRQMLVTVISIAVVFFYIMLRNRKQLIRFSVGLSCVILVIAFNFSTIEETINSYSGQLYFRVITKTEAFLHGETTEGDSMRKELMADFMNDMETYIFPHGFVSKQTATDPETGMFNDFPFSELAWMLGIAGAILPVLYFGYAAFRCYNLSKRGDRTDLLFVFTLSYWGMLTLLFLEGSFLSYPYTVPFAGYCLGGLQRYSRISFVMHKSYK